jgi:3-hydroxyacyl-CoA dehydrogenase / enoyl-CoA hydratase / 3-hydroxybutyryl-CoA epimerase / enoyl-CoA isomerase
LPMVLEAAVALEEGVVESPAALDTAMSLGLGFPKYAGGPLKYADCLGPDRIIELSTRYARIGPLYRASDELRRRAAEGAKFYPE